MCTPLLPREQVEKISSVLKAYLQSPCLHIFMIDKGNLYSMMVWTDAGITV